MNTTLKKIHISKEYVSYLSKIFPKKYKKLFMEIEEALKNRFKIIYDDELNYIDSIVLDPRCYNDELEYDIDRNYICEKIHEISIKFEYFSQFKTKRGDPIFSDK